MATTHQGPTFINYVVNKKGSVARIYLPPAARWVATL